MPRVTAAAIVVVNHNTATELLACLSSVRATCNRPVVVVDNGSNDDSVARVRACYPDTAVLERRNLGYGAGANVGIQWAVDRWSAEVVVLLNADTRVGAAAVEGLVEHVAGGRRIGVAGPSVVDPSGTPQRTAHAEPTPVRILLQESRLWRFAAPPAAPAWLLGAALALRTDAWEEIGGFDEAFGMYFEEVDLCRRLRDAGWAVEQVAAVEVVHHGGASTDQVRWPLRRRYFSSAGRYFQLHHDRADVVGLHVVVAVIALAQLAATGVRRVLRPSRSEPGALRTWVQVLSDDARGWPDRPWP